MFPPITPVFIGVLMYKGLYMSPNVGVWVIYESLWLAEWVLGS